MAKKELGITTKLNISLKSCTDMCERIFEEGEDYITFVCQGEMYTFKQITNVAFVKEYMLYNNRIRFNPNIENTILRIPFPEDRIDGAGGDQTITDSFKIKCSLEYLKAYYQCYKDVRIEDNIIYYKNVRLQVEEDVVTVTMNPELH